MNLNQSVIGRFGSRLAATGALFALLAAPGAKAQVCPNFCSILISQRVPFTSGVGDPQHPMVTVYNDGTTHGQDWDGQGFDGGCDISGGFDIYYNTPSGGSSPPTTVTPSFTVPSGITFCEEVLPNSAFGYDIHLYDFSQPCKVTVSETVASSGCTTLVISNFSFWVSGCGGSCGIGCNGTCSPGPITGFQPQTKSFGVMSAAVDNLDQSFYMGPASLYGDGGMLWISAYTPSTSLASPAGLQLPFVGQNVTEITNADGTVAQVVTPLGIANVTPATNYQYQIQFYGSNSVTAPTGTNTLYTINGGAQSVVTYLVSNPDTNSADSRLWITEERPGLSNRVFQYTYSNTTNQPQCWSLLEPDGLTTLSNWALPNPTNVNITNYYTETTWGANVLQLTCAQVQFVSATNQVITNSFSTGFGGLTNTTYYTYYPTNSTNSNVILMQSVYSPNSNWVYYVYDEMGRVTNQYSAFGNGTPPVQGTQPDPATTPCKITSFAYTLNTTEDGILDDGSLLPYQARRTIVSLPVSSGGGWTNQEVSRVYDIPQSQVVVEEQKCAIPGVQWNSTNNLYSVMAFYDGTQSGITAAEGGQAYYMANADGTMTMYDYVQTSTNFTTYSSTGAPDDWSNPTTIADGTKTTTVKDLLGRTLSVTTVDIVSGSTVSGQTATFSSSDPTGRDYSVTDLAGNTTSMDYECCGLNSVTDPDDVVTMYFYDQQRRNVATETVRGTNGNNITVTNTLDGLGRTLVSQRIGTNGSVITMSQMLYDALGRVASRTNALGGVTTIVYSAPGNPLCVTNTNPDGGTSIQIYNLDGTLQLTTGTAVPPMQYVYGATNLGGVYRSFMLTTKVSSGGGTNEWTEAFTDGAGNPIETITAGSSSNAVSLSYYNASGPPGGQLTNTVDADGVSTLYGYDDRGKQVWTVADLNQNHSIDFSGGDRITFVTNDVVTDHGATVNRTQTFVWNTNGVNSSNLISTVESSADGLKSWNTIWNSGVGVTSSNVTVYAGSGSRYGTNVAADGSYQVSVFKYGQLMSAASYNSSRSQIGGSSYGYDVFGRKNAVADARNGATTYTFNNQDQVVSTTTPSPGSGLAPEVTTQCYDTQGRNVATTLPDNTSVTNAYYPTSQLKLTYGSRTYPVGYSYDAQNRMLTMTNWTGFNTGSSPSGREVTKWNYDSCSGQMTSKVYADSNGPSYTYTGAGRLASRMWARGTNTSYLYDTAGGLTNVSYNDGATATVAYGYDRRGRQNSITNNSIVTTLSLNDPGETLSEAYSGGPLSGISVTNGYDSLLRRTNVVTLNGSTVLCQTTNTFDTASRLSFISDGTNSATYSYLANSPLVSQIVFAHNGTTEMKTTKQYDFLDRLLSINSLPSGANQQPLSYQYVYNSANERVRDTMYDGSHWEYNYDTLGQVTSGKKYWAENKPVPGEQFGYSFDTIGNRTSTLAGGDINGGSLRSATYAANSLNQYTNRTVPNQFDVLGLANVSATVKVNGSTPDYQRGEFFHELVTVTNTSAAVWDSVSVNVTNGASVSNVVGSVFIPPATESFTYDADGNLSSDGRWNYTWDAENRLIGMTSLSGAPTNSQLELYFQYDWKSRRIQKQVSTNNGSAYVASYTNNFLYDAWNLQAVINPTSGLLNSFVWGLDLSGSLQGAGGVGGLVASKQAGSNPLFSAIDGNGNVMGLVDATAGTNYCSYDYGPFGEPIRLTPNSGNPCPVMFSTKFTDLESGFAYFIYRYYNPSTGKWVNRDPMAEAGFELIRQKSSTFESASPLKNISDDAEPTVGDYEWNRYAFVLNQSTASIDPFGLDITLERGNDTWNPINNAIHCQVCVANCKFDKTCFSFGAIGAQLPEFSRTWLGWPSPVFGAIIQGQIYLTGPAPGASIIATYNTNATQDNNWFMYMMRRRGLIDGYSVGRHNCVLYSAMEFTDAPLHW